MTKLGTWPQDIYYLSWMTQRLANRAPEWTHARKWSWSIMQQMLNPAGADLELVTKQLIEERNNIFMSSTNISLMDRLYRLELGVGMEFDVDRSEDGIDIYKPPTVYATIDDVEHEITIAKENTIDTLFYKAIPSRVEYGEESYSYYEVIPRTTIADLSSLSPGEIVVHGHLYITIRGNTTWEYRGRKMIYYPKVYIRGTTRKGTEVEEAIPIRYNGTFKTINQWKSVTEVFVSYLDSTAEITVECLLFDKDNQLDTRNLIIPASGTESWRFLKLDHKVWGSLLVSEGFTTSSFDVVRMGFDTLDYEYKIELHDAAGDPVVLTAMAIIPNSDYICAIDNNNFYVYTSKLPYPNMTVLEQDSPDTRMDLYSDRWIYTVDDIAVFKTDILDITSIPWMFRWTLLEPDGSEYYLDIDGNKLALTEDAWISNDKWELSLWDEKRMELLIENRGTHTLTLECLYSDSRKPNNNYTLTTRFLYYVPVAEPETVIPLPDELKGSSDISFDSDNNLWFQKDGSVYLSNIFHDYFLVDYTKRAIWFRENYNSVRVVL